MSSFFKGLYIRYLANVIKLDNILSVILILGCAVALCIVFTGALYVGQFVYNWLSIHIETLNVESNPVRISQNYALSRLAALFGSVVVVIWYFIVIISFFNYKKNYNTVVNWIKSTSAYSNK